MGRDLGEHVPPPLGRGQPVGVGDGEEPGTDWHHTQNGRSLKTCRPTRKKPNMTRRTATVSENLRAIADLIEAHPDLPAPFVTAYGHKAEIEASWYLHIHGLKDDPDAQKVAAVRLVTTLGGKWDKGESGDVYALDQVRGGVKLHITVNRAAVCERVVTGTREVTVPARPASDAEPERVETVEDVTWVCSSLLADAVSA